MNRRFLYVGILLFLSQACARRVSQGSGDAIKEYSEDLSATRPVVHVEKAAGEEEQNGENDAEAFVASKAPQSENERIEEAIRKISQHNASATSAAGYRISVFAGNSRSEFESAKSYVMQHFPELELYESYSQPTYRLRVGDFLRRMDAERYYSSLLGRFDSAKITSENINVQKGLRIN